MVRSFWTSTKRGVVAGTVERLRVCLHPYYEGHSWTTNVK